MANTYEHHQFLINEQFEVLKIPQTTHQAGTRIDFRSRRTYKSKHLQEVEAFYTNLLKPFAPEVPIVGGALVEISFHYKTAKRLRGLPRLSRPDVDNMAKTVLDVMTKLGYWNDDSQVIQLKAAKFNSDINRICIKVSEEER